MIEQNKTYKLPDASEIKLITTDLDGTLLNTRRRISDRTSIVIRKILKKYPNLHFVLASGRAKPATKLIRERLGIEDRPHTESLLCNGCLVYDSKGSIIWQNVIPKGFMLEVHKLVCENKLPKHVVIYSTGDVTVLFDERWINFAIEKCDEDAVLEDKQAFLKKIESGEAKVNKIGFMIFEPSDAEEIQFLLSKAAKKYNMVCTRSNVNFIEYMPPLTNKGTGLAQLIKNLNIKKEEVIAFGDGGNDIELLENAGWPVAMANGNDKLKSLAKFIAKTNAEDGVVDVLEKIFLKDELIEKSYPL